MEEIIPGGVINSLKDIPLPDMADIDLSYPHVGTDYLLQPWYWIVRNSRELLESSFMDELIWIGNTLYPKWVLFLLVPFIFAVGWTVGSLWKWFKKRYINNNWL